MNRLIIAEIILNEMSQDAYNYISAGLRDLNISVLSPFMGNTEKILGFGVVIDSSPTDLCTRICQNIEAIYHRHGFTGSCEVSYINTSNASSVANFTI